MNILFLNTTYICGGAEKVTNQIMEGMKKRGHQVYEIVSYYKLSKPLPENVSALYSGTPMLLLNRLLTGNHSNASLTIPYSLHQILSFIRQHQIDVIHLHNAHGNFLGINDIKAISDICPVIWTLHDFWALTGHCTYPTGCPNLWKSGCLHCPQLSNYPPIRRDIAGRLLQMKGKAFGNNNIHYTVPSKWMKEQFLNSHLHYKDCTCIPNSINTHDWICYDKQMLRQRYQIPTNKNIIAFVAADPQKKLKGMHFLFQALSKITSPEDYLLLIAGRKSSLSSLEHQGFQIRHFGYINNQKEMNEFYALADILVNPSLYETFGLVNIEAMASGTPVIVFPVCAMEELISPESGWCIPQIQSEALASTIEAVFSDHQELARKKIEARKRVEMLFSEDQMLNAYENLYQKYLKC